MSHELVIEKEFNKKTGELIYRLKGSVNVATAPKLENDLRRSLTDVKKLTFDFKDLDILTSAGIRVLLTASEVMAKQGHLSIINANESIRELFDITSLTEELHVH